jgi:mediator of RNA polymerase II transcription subunit 14
MQVYENGLATVKIPKSIRQGSDLLLMSIPNCGKSYFLLMQLDVDFKPLFTMLESHQDSTGYHQISRFRKIDVGRIQIVEEEVNFSLSYNEGSLSSARETRGSDRISESGPTSDLSTDAVIQGQEGLKSAFSSVVDKGMPLPRCLPKQKIFLSSDEPSPSGLLGTGQCMQQVEKFGLSSPRCDGTSQFPAMDENEIRKVIDSPKDGLPIYSDNRQTCVPSLHASPANRSPIQNSRSHPKSSPTGQAETMLKSLASGLRVISPVCKLQL